MRISIIFFPVLVLLSACTVNQDIHFEADGKVINNVKLDMGQFIRQMPQMSSTPGAGFGNLQDSLMTPEIIDSLKQYGISNFNVEFDSVNYTIKMFMSFNDINSYNTYINKDRDKNIKPIENLLTNKKFTLKNANSFMPSDFMGGMDGGNDEVNAQMYDFITVTTTYHFPYEIKDFKSASGNAVMGENRKSIVITNSLTDMTTSDFSGDLEVDFK